MKAKNKFNSWLWALSCISCLLTSCDHEVHGDENEGGLSVSLIWQDKADQGTEVKDVKLRLFNADNGSLVEEKRYGSAEEVASQRFQLPEGNYHILATVNLTEPFLINEATSALADWNNITIGLTHPKEVKKNAYFGVADVRIAAKEKSYTVRTPIKSVLAELTVIIEDAPKGAKMNGKALDAAQSLFPTRKNGDGDYGLPGVEPVEVEFPTALATETALQSEIIRLMPTAPTSETSHIYLSLSLPNQILQEFDITAPAMKAGGKYELRFKYNEMQPKMNLSATINNWKEINDEAVIK